MKATIITVGTELLFGKIADTNSAYISAELQNLGVDVMYRHTVGDNPDRLRKMLAVSFEDCDLVITTGGLGPTQDDLTKEIVTQFLGDQLATHAASLESITTFFQRLQRPMTENNKKQALMPTKAVVFDNLHGTAPGFALTTSGRTAICLPGPPREMKAMFERHVKPYISSKSHETIYYRMLRTFGIGESSLESALEDLIANQTDPTIATYAKEGECSLRIASKKPDSEQAKAAVQAMSDVVMERVGEYVFSDNDEDMHQVVGNELIRRNISISCAESCTGGMFAARLTDIPGISAVFNRGFVTYSNEAKNQELGVPIDTIRTYGAVSEETAVSMATGLKDKTGSNICISVTGIAGPDGETVEKPVGLIYICCIFDDKIVCKRFLGRNSGRDWNRNYAVLNMFNIIWRLLKDQ